MELWRSDVNVPFGSPLFILMYPVQPVQPVQPGRGFKALRAFQIILLIWQVPADTG
jgi:hypothetical protein